PGGPAPLRRPVGAAAGGPGGPQTVAESPRRPLPGRAGALRVGPLCADPGPVVRAPDPAPRRGTAGGWTGGGGGHADDTPATRRGRARDTPGDTSLGGLFRPLREGCGGCLSTVGVGRPERRPQRVVHVSAVLAREAAAP